MYLGLLSSNTLPPKAITLSWVSNIGNINLFLNLSINFPSGFLLTKHEARISSSVKPLDFNSVYNSLNLPEYPILKAFRVLLSKCLFFTYSCPGFAVGLYKFSW